MKSGGRKPTKTQRRRAPQGPWVPKAKVPNDVPRTASGKVIRPPRGTPKDAALGTRPRPGVVEEDAPVVRKGKPLPEVGRRPDKKSIKKAAQAAGPRVSAAEASARAEIKLDGFVAKFSETNQKFIRDARTAMRKRLPTAFELVYDNFDFFVISYGPTDRTSDAIFSIVANANGVGLAFLKGATLPDPKKILLGTGKLSRYIQLESVADLQTPVVEELMSAAVAQSKVALALSGSGPVIVKAVSVKQRARR